MLSILTTKIKIPLPPPQPIQRPRLIDTLEHQITHHRLILVSTPAGYGKTTLLAQWARASQFSVAWFSLDDADNDFERFFRYLQKAWETVQPEIAESQLDTLLGGMSPARDAVLTAFINVAYDIPHHTVFVLDDYHLINDPAIHEALTFLLDHLPPTLHFILASRGEPALPLARYRAKQTMLDLNTADLRFLPTETEQFLNARMKLALNQVALEKLQEQLEGWVTGLQLIALTMKRGLTEVDQLALNGRHRFITDYLSQEIVSQLPDEIQRFLFQTSILDRLCGSLCKAVTGRDDSLKILAAVERDNLFLTPLDDQREWFRFHHLFADFLYEELEKRYPDTVAVLHQRAAQWYLDHNQAEPAFHHAVAGEDADLVVKVLERFVTSMLIGGELESLKKWLDVLPEDWHTTYPIIDLFQTGFFLFTGRLEASVHQIEVLEQRLKSTKREDIGSQLARVNAMRCSIACFQDDLARAKTYADEAFQDLSDTDYLFRTIIYGSLGDTYRRHRRWQEAKDCYLAMLDFIYTPENRLQSVHVFGALADLYLRQGHLREAANYWRKALTIIHEQQNWGRFPLPLIGWVQIRMAELLYEWNELDEAWEFLDSGLERAELGGDVRAILAGYLIAGRLKLSTGDFDSAEKYLEAAKPLIEDVNFPNWSSRFDRLQVDLWLTRERLRKAIDWTEEIQQEKSLVNLSEDSDTQLVLARVLIIKGDHSSLKQVSNFLGQLISAAATEGRIGIQIEALTLLALSNSQRGDAGSAIMNLEHALRLAEPEGYVRSFVDLGLPVARLLQEARARNVMPDYTKTLLEAFDSSISSNIVTQPTLPEPLTEREEEVLELLAAGLTNPEIAEKLVISAGTVKKHASNIYGKLGVSGRTEAAARARELNLLD